MQKLKFKYDDGGRKKAGIPGTSGDCVIRAIAIAEKIPYKKAQEIVAAFIARDYNYGILVGMSEKSRTGLHGVYNSSALIKSLGYTFVPTPGKRFRAYMGIPRGRVIIALSGHLAAVINTRLHDQWDSQKTGIRPMLGYFIKL